MDDLLHTFLPLKTVKVHPSDKPWVTTQFNDLIHQRQQALLSGNNERYKWLRNKINKMVKYLRSSFYQENVNVLKYTDSKKWWVKLWNLSCTFGYGTLLTLSLPNI